MEPAFLALEEVLEIHRDQIERYGGRPGVRDMDLLQSALAAPMAAMRGGYLLADVFEMAGAYLYHLVRNHPFVDGNKRVGAVSALVFLDLSGVRVRLTSQALYGLVIGVAEGRTTRSEVAAALRRSGRSRPR
jgi:death-on-curing protein